MCLLGGEGGEGGALSQNGRSFFINLLDTDHACPTQPSNMAPRLDCTHFTSPFNPNTSLKPPLTDHLERETRSRPLLDPITPHGFHGGRWLRLRVPSHSSHHSRLPVLHYRLLLLPRPFGPSAAGLHCTSFFHSLISPSFSTVLFIILSCHPPATFLCIRFVADPSNLVVVGSITATSPPPSVVTVQTTPSQDQSLI